MNLHVNHRIDRFCIAGISYRKADFEVRGRYSIDEMAKEAILKEAAALGLKSIALVSTCNRTEVYGYANSPAVLASLLLKFSKGGTTNELQAFGYFHQGFEALRHIFRVGSGLDSQIIGDFEIAGQLKQAFSFSQKRGMVGPIMDRTFGFISQASKKIKNQTALSSGTVSVSFAAIEWLQQQLNGRKANILVVGAGKFGANVIKNLLNYLPGCTVTISNRTPERAADVAWGLPVHTLPFDQVPMVANEFDSIITCTNSPLPLIKSEYFSTTRKRWLIDLSVPANIDSNVKFLADVCLVNVDDISVMLDKTINRRLAEVPRAEAIIEEHIETFYNWLASFRHAPLVNELKCKLRELSDNNTRADTDGLLGFGANAGGYEENIQSTVSNLMVNLKTRREKGCSMIAAYHDFFTMQNTGSLP
jgi:glutamyl-tRNA reductase